MSGQLLSGAKRCWPRPPPAGTLRELLALPRPQTAGYAIGSSGLASVPHFTYERLRIQTGLTLNHVPYKGSGAALALPLLRAAARLLTDVASLDDVLAGRL